MSTTLPIRQVAADVCVAPQLTPNAMAELARLGFRSVVNNRPDFEEGPGQPTNAAIEAAARAAGLAYAYLPVSPMFQSPEEIARFAQLLADLPHPLLAFCRSGTRSHSAAKAATDAGYPDCYNVLEGFEGQKDASGQRNKAGGWRHAGLPWYQS